MPDHGSRGVNSPCKNFHTRKPADRSFPPSDAQAPVVAGLLGAGLVMAARTADLVVAAGHSDEAHGVLPPRFPITNVLTESGCAS